MARMRFDVPRFITDYTEAVNAGLTLEEIATLLGLSTACISQRVQRLAKRGIQMPKRKHGLVGMTRVRLLTVKPRQTVEITGDPRPDTSPSCAGEAGGVTIVPAAPGFTIIVGGHQ